MKRLSVTHRQTPQPSPKPKSQRRQSQPHTPLNSSLRTSMKPKSRPSNNPTQRINNSFTITHNHPLKPPTKITNSNPKPRTPNSHTHPPIHKKQPFRSKYLQAVGCVFKRIDSLNQSYIDSYSLTRCVDPRVLYFFGPIFHRIKTKELKMGKYEFMIHAERVFDKATVQDVREFVQAMEEIGCGGGYQGEKAKESEKAEGWKEKEVVGVGRKSFREYETSKIITKGQQAIQQALAHRKKHPPQLQPHLDFSHIDLEFHPKHKNTPLFQGNSNLGLVELDLNKPIPICHFSQVEKLYEKHQQQQQQQQQSDTKHSNLETREQQATVSWQYNDKENVKYLSESRKRHQQSKLGKLKDRLDYFIQKNSEHLHISQCIRLQNGF